MTAYLADIWDGREIITYILGAALFAFYGPEVRIPRRAYRFAVVLTVLLTIGLIPLFKHDRSLSSALLWLPGAAVYFSLSTDKLSTSMYMFLGCHNAMYLAVLGYYFVFEAAGRRGPFSLLASLLVFAVIAAVLRVSAKITRLLCVVMNQMKIPFFLLSFCFTVTIRMAFAQYGYGTGGLRILCLCLGIVLCMLAARIFIYFSIWQTHKAARAEEAETYMLIMRAQMDLQREQIARYAENRAMTLRINHDLRHHNEVVLGLLRLESREKAEEYLLGLQKHLDSVKVTDYCAHPTVNVVLSRYLAKAEESGIRTDIRASVPETLSIDHAELAAVFANALENAAEACARTEPETRFIRLLAGAVNGQLRLQVDNPCPRGTVFDDTGLPVSQKEKGGIGTRNIRFIAERRGGCAEFSEKDGIFTLKVVIPVEGDPVKGDPGVDLGSIP